VARIVAEVRHADLRQAARDEARRFHPHARRAECHARARDRRSRLRARARQESLRRSRPAAARGPGGEAAVSGRVTVAAAPGAALDFYIACPGGGIERLFRVAAPAGPLKTAVAAPDETAMYCLPPI